VSDKFQKEYDDSQNIKDNRAKIFLHGTRKHPPSFGVRNEPRIFYESRKRMEL
jgi:hypothetical protein